MLIDTFTLNNKLLKYFMPSIDVVPTLVYCWVNVVEYGMSAEIVIP